MTLQVESLGIGLAAETGATSGGGRLVEDVAFDLPDSATLGIVGESGSGKSLLALAVIGLLPKGIAATGQVLLDGRDLLSLPEAKLCHVRGASIGMIFQEPMTALNPAMRIGDQIAEGLAWHRGTGRAEARAEALRLLDRVRIPDAHHRLHAYPHELSGGQRQRVGIAIALAPGPKLLIADEPTTALDVTVQAEILDLLDELVGELGMSLIVISHDLGVIARMADRTLVMYAGTRVEEGPTEVVLRQPLHPYTRGLLAAMPHRLAPAEGGARRALRLASIPGGVPKAGQLPPGCRFTPRCPAAIAACGAAEPAWRAIQPGHAARCIRAEELA
jgi:peptide/nickel transport system ATP-binding protein